MRQQSIIKLGLVLLFAGALTACSSTSDQTDSSSSKTTQQSEKNSRPGVETGALTPVEEARYREFEEQQARYTDLREQRVIHFGFDESSIQESAKEVLAAHADHLVRNPDVTLVIEGHTDERGTPEYNIALGERRAKSVMDYLQSLGVSSKQISLVSYGEEKPLVRQSNDRAWAENRRAVLVY